MILRPPLHFSFKLIALASQIFVSDARGAPLLYVRQRLLKIKEDIFIHRDENARDFAYRIRADRWLDFNANYTITNHLEQVVGSVHRRGLRSLVRATYEVMDQFGRQAFTIEQESIIKGLINGIFEEIPVLGYLSGYVLNPTYLVKNAAGQTVMKLHKRPALFEGRYELLEETIVPDAERELIALSLIMMMLLERTRG